MGFPVSGPEPRRSVQPCSAAGQGSDTYALTELLESRAHWGSHGGTHRPSLGRLKYPWECPTDTTKGGGSWTGKPPGASEGRAGAEPQQRLVHVTAGGAGPQCGGPILDGWVMPLPGSHFSFW